METGNDLLKNPWKGLPREMIAPWQRIFDTELSALKLSSPCPICGQAELYRYYDLNEEDYKEIEGIMFRGWGSLWEWCRSCRHYEHMSSRVPEKWRHTLPVDRSMLRHHPDAIDRALSEVLANDGGV